MDKLVSSTERRPIAFVFGALLAGETPRLLEGKRASLTSASAVLRLEDEQGRRDRANEEERVSSTVPSWRLVAVGGRKSARELLVPSIREAGYIGRI